MSMSQMPIADNQITVLRALFRRNGGIVMAHQLHEAGFTDFEGLIKARLIYRRPGRWDVGFNPGSQLDPVVFPTATEGTIHV